MICESCYGKGCKNCCMTTQEMTYKLIQECGLEVRFGEITDPSAHPAYSEAQDYYVKASDLEAFLSKAVRVYGYQCPKEGSIFSVTKAVSDTHEALAINIREIPKLEPVSKEEILETIQNAGVMMDEAINKVIERIKSAGVKP